KTETCIDKGREICRSNFALTGLLYGRLAPNHFSKKYRTETPFKHIPLNAEEHKCVGEVCLSILEVLEFKLEEVSESVNKWN
ncbi:hypothetical protein CEXT_546321, partial [Caerostris extrusa]